MKGPLLQPAGKFWQLAPRHQEMRRETAADLAAMIRALRGDPRLTYWEEGFFANVEGILRQTGGRVQLTRKQWEKAWQIRDRLETVTIKAEDEEPDEAGDQPD